LRASLNRVQAQIEIYSRHLIDINKDRLYPDLNFPVFLEAVFKRWSV